MTELLQPLFAAMGLLLESFNVESVTLPEALQKRMDERMGMGIVGDLSRYTQYQTAQAIPIAAQNEGGVAGIGAGIAAGVGMGNAMTAAMLGQQMRTARSTSGTGRSNRGSSGNDSRQHCACRG